ncbi:MAG: ABC transporter permease subunit [Bacillota bacterium]
MKEEIKLEGEHKIEEKSPEPFLIKTKKIIRKNIVPLLFTITCLLGVKAANIPVFFLLNSIFTRIFRNSFMVLSLIIPVMAGMGLNFGIVLGAMAGQMALIAVTHWEITGGMGLFVAFLITTPIALLFGWLAGIILNRARGREMITSLILGFFANGLYQLFFLYFMGTIIPIKNKVLMLSNGVGIRNTVDLKAVKYSLDRAFTGIVSFNAWLKSGAALIFEDVTFMPYIPLATMLVIILLCVGLKFFTKTKIGQEFRSVGQDNHISEIMGINVEKTRILSVVISTVLAGWAQLIFLQNIGTLNTYGSHVQVGLFAVAALLIGGASVTKATIGQALLGTVLFHTLFIISPLAGQALLGDPQVGEYFRVFVAYGVIGVALGLHAWQKHQEIKDKLKAG